MNSTTIQNQAHPRGHRGDQRIKPTLFSVFTLRSPAYFAVKALLMLMLLTLALFATTTHAEDYSNNIGFMKNPPKELKEKFPMCDQFLDVKWIRQFPNGGWVGTVTADVYFVDKKERRELVVMQEQRKMQPFDSKTLRIVDVSNSNYKAKPLSELILSADEYFSNYVVKSEGYRKGFSVRKDRKWTNVAMAEEGIRYSDYSRNLCVSLPKGAAGWIIEYHKPFWDYRQLSSSEKTKLEQFKALAAKECSKPNNEIERDSTFKDICSIFVNGEGLVRNGFVLQDVDGDGTPDYRSGRLVAFLNDSRPFFMNMPKECFHNHYYYEHQEKLKEERCVADAKRKFLENKEQ